MLKVVKLPEGYWNNRCDYFLVGRLMLQELLPYKKKKHRKNWIEKKGFIGNEPV